MTTNKKKQKTGHRLESNYHNFETVGPLTFTWVDFFLGLKGSRERWLLPIIPTIRLQMIHTEDSFDDLKLFLSCEWTGYSKLEVRRGKKDGSRVFVTNIYVVGGRIVS